MATFVTAKCFASPVTSQRLSGRHAVALPSLAAPAQRRLRPSPALRCRATATDQELLSAQKRWEAQVRDGKVRNVAPSEVRALLADGWTVLDVRPPTEIAKARLEGAVEVPLFVLDDEVSVGNLIKQSTNFGMGGWWLGGGHMKPNPAFLADVQARVPKDAKLLVVCQKGLRSLAACEQLSRAGYASLSWINGGLDTVSPGEVETKNNVDIRLGGVGGLSGFLGWTEPQRDAGKSFAGGFENIIKGVAVILALDVVWFLVTISTPPPQ